MTALDRAFIKAYAEAPASVARHGTTREPTLSAVAAPRAPIAHAARAHLSIADPPSRSPSDAVSTYSVPDTAPLSTFTPRVKPDDTLRAAFEVDELAWPQACVDLLTRARRGWDTFADLLAARLAEGEKCVAVAGRSSGEGCTTIALATAMHLAARGVQCVVVDANFDNPALVASCGIAAHAGWADVVAGERPLGEALISSAADRVTLVPWRGRGKHSARPGDELRLAATFNALQEQYDLVLIDAAPLAAQAAVSDFASLAESIGLDAVYLIQDARMDSGDDLRKVCDALESAGVHVGGLIENFAASAAANAAPARLKLPAFASRLLARRGYLAQGDSHV